MHAVASLAAAARISHVSVRFRRNLRREPNRGRSACEWRRFAPSKEAGNMNGQELARRLFEGANARDWDAVAALHGDDHAYHDPQGPPTGRGGDAMAKHLAFYVEALDGRWEVHEIAD